MPIVLWLSNYSSRKAHGLVHPAYPATDLLSDDDEFIAGERVEGKRIDDVLRVTTLHLVASGGCDPQRWDDTPKPLEAPILHRLVRIILSAGGYLEARDNHHQATPLSWAAWFGCHEGMRAMLMAGANRDAEDGYMYGSTARWTAHKRSGVDLDVLLQSTARVRASGARALAPPHQ